MKKRKLNEDLFIDVPEVEYELDTNIDLEGPQPGNDVGVSGLLLDLIGDIAKTISNYNQLQADLKDYPEIAEVIKDFADDENVKLGKVQSALKTISPNAEYIMNGAVEADQELDPGSPLDESYGLYEMARTKRPNPEDKFRSNDLGEALTEQASYGGAFDIEDDMFFTKEDLMEFAYDLKEEFAAWCGDKNADISDLYMTSPTHLYIEVMSDGATHSAEIDIDMRKIRTAGDIYKYSDDVLDQWKKSYIEYNPDFEKYKYEV